MNCLSLRALGARACLTALFVMFAACGEEPEPAPKPPVMSMGQITCVAAPQGSNVDYEVVREVSVMAQDEDRDLLGVTGTLNGIQMGSLEDPDADQRFNWTPPMGLDPIICDGDLTLRFEATDQAGNVVELVEIITK